MSLFKEKLTEGDFVVTSELTPPKGIDIRKMLTTAEQLKEYVDAFNITDSHNARMSLSPLAAAHALIRAEVEPILQMTTRDRNRIALQSDMLGAASLGVQHLVCMGGDPPHLGDHPDAKPVFDFSTEALISAAAGLAMGKDSTGNELNEAPELNVGAVVNPGADDLDTEITRLEKKIESGARYFQTQAIFDPAAFEAFMNRVMSFQVPIIAGILPVKSAKMADHMNKNVPGIDVPETIVQTIEAAEDVKSVSADISAEIIREIRPMCQGVHIMAIGWEALIPTILEKAK
jgi:methylenetetrahydrofolate reductase (NADPH)